MFNPFLKLMNEKKGNDLNIKKKISEEKTNQKSKPLIIFGFIISITSIILLLFIINNRFG